MTIPVVDSFVKGVPVSKPRMTRSDKWKRRKCVVEYRAWADTVREQVLGDKDLMIDDLRAGSVQLVFQLPVLKSHPKHLQGKLHDRRPDLDNLVKSVLDSLFANDSHIATLRATKFFAIGTMSGVQVVLRPSGGGDTFHPPLNLVSRLAAQQKEEA